jgi:uncharacterized membrane protein YeaQ/YmgE (transglycosylase-associated protein family)
MGILSWIVFGGLAGLAASFLLGGGGGIIFDIIMGTVGALLGGFLMGLFGHTGAGKSPRTRLSAGAGLGRQPSRVEAGSQTARSGRP